MKKIALSSAAAAVALALLPGTAQAQSAPLQAASYSISSAKTEAILGGSSALAAIMAKQQGLTAAPAPLFPAAYSAPKPTYSVLRTVAPRNSGVTSGRPDVFGSVALSVGHTRLDYRWRKVANAGVRGAPALFAASLAGQSELDRIEAINRYVNDRIAFVDDSRQYGSEDLWATASDTLRRGRGDCEDYAIAKLQMLRKAGFSSRDLYLVIAKDLVRRADHAVLVVRAAGQMLVLDNGTDRVTNADLVQDYRPVLTFSASGAWTHGYRRAVPTMTLASASVEPLTPSADVGTSN